MRWGVLQELREISMSFLAFDDAMHINCALHKCMLHVCNHMQHAKCVVDPNCALRTFSRSVFYSEKLLYQAWISKTFCIVHTRHTNIYNVFALLCYRMHTYGRVKYQSLGRPVELAPRDYYVVASVSGLCVR